MLTATELKAAAKAILTSGAAHPPTLPEVLELAAASSGKKRTRFPEPFSPEWNEQRRELMAKIAKQTAARGVTFTDAQRDASRKALTLAELAPGMVGYEEAVAAYQALPTRGLRP